MIRSLALLGALLLLLPIAAPAQPGHAHPEMLVEPAWLAEHLRDAGLRIVDLRSAAAYQAGHIPGAVQLEEGPLRNPEDRLTYLPKPETLAEMLGRAGIGNETPIIAYDDQGGRTAARLWYVLNAYGDSRVRILNGGWPRWARESRPLSREVPQVARARFTPRVTPELTCPSPEVLARKPGVVVLDTRSEREYKASRIPGAVNVDWMQNLTPEGNWKSATELLQLYERRGITPDKEIISHCASGGRAAHTLFTLKLLGYPKVRIYYGSFSDYTSRPEAPLEK